MTRKIAYFALAVVVAVVLASGMVPGTAGVVLADSEGAGYGTMDSSFSSEREMDAVQTDAGEIRKPVEAGALPEGSARDDYGNWLNIDAGEQNSSPELWGRPNIQSSE